MSTLDKLQEALDNKTLNTDKLSNEQRIIIDELIRQKKLKGPTTRELSELRGAARRKAARDKEGRFIKRKGLAFVIGRAIAQRGLTRTQFFSAPYKKNMKYYINKITNAYAEDVEDDIVNKIKDIK